MTGLLVSHTFVERFGERLAQAEADSGLEVERIVLAAGADARLDDVLAERVELAFFSGDLLGPSGRPFFEALDRAPGLRWLHVFHAGVDAPRYGELLAQGVRLSNSSGSHAEPIAQTAITALLMLARGFPRWIDAQRRHAWDRLARDEGPRDLRGQTLLVVGVGAIGSEIARLARAVGLHVIGVRHSRGQPDDPVDEMHQPSKLPELLPRADWLVLACPLNDETRGMIDAGALSRLPRGARLINVSRGAVVDEPAVIEALRSGQLGGAYLDVFAQEPLPAESPLWDLPNVLITPHNSAVSAGNDARATEIFLRNLVRWGRGEPLEHEVRER